MKEIRTRTDLSMTSTKFKHKIIFMMLHLPNLSNFHHYSHYQGNIFYTDKYAIGTNVFHEQSF